MHAGTGDITVYADYTTDYWARYEIYLYIRVFRHVFAHTLEDDCFPQSCNACSDDPTCAGIYNVNTTDRSGYGFTDGDVTIEIP